MKRINGLDCNPRAIFVDFCFRGMVASSEATTDSHSSDSTKRFFLSLVYLSVWCFITYQLLISKHQEVFAHKYGVWYLKSIQSSSNSRGVPFRRGILLLLLLHHPLVTFRNPGSFTIPLLMLTVLLLLLLTELDSVNNVQQIFSSPLFYSSSL